MVPVVEQLLEHARGAWRFRVVAVIVAWVVALVGWVVVFLMPHSYEASARVFVSTSTALKPLLEGLAVQQDVESQLSLVRENLLGRPRLERVAREADLDLRANTPIERERVIAALQESIQIRAQAPRSGRDDAPRSSDSVYTITYSHADRERALTVVRSLLNSLMEDTMAGRREGSDTAQRFLQGQIEQYERRLADAEAALVAFKQRNVGLVPGAQGDFFSRLQNEGVAIKKVEADLQIALRRRATLAAQLQGQQPFSPTGGTVVTPTAALGSAGSPARLAGGSDTASRIAETQAKLDELLLRFTERHPDVVTLRETLEQLKARQQAEIEALRRGDAGAAAASGLASNPVYQSIQLQINQVDVEIAQLRGQLDMHRRSEAELRRIANVAPEVEAEYARLTRDYDVERAQYTALLERLEKARLSEDAAGTGIVEFEVINPPTAALESQSVQKPLLLAAVLALALAAGAAVAWLLSQLRPVFDGTRALAEFTGLPVLGSVSRTWAERHAAVARAQLVRLGSAAAALLLVFGVLVVVTGTAVGGHLRTLLGT